MINFPCRGHRHGFKFEYLGVILLVYNILLIYYFTNYKNYSIIQDNWARKTLPVFPESTYLPFSPAVIHIPKIIHQTWKSKEDLPNQFIIWAATCKKLHPDYTYKLWSDDDNRMLVETEYPWFLDTYDKLPYTISRVDAIRYMVIHKFGGFFFDLDFECLTSLDPYLNSAIIMSHLDTSPEVSFGNHVLPNSFIGAAPGHPFLIFLLERMKSNIEEGAEGSVEEVAGSIFLYNSYRDWTKPENNERTKNSPAIEFIIDGRIYGYDWRYLLDDEKSRTCSAQNFDFNPARCKELIPSNAIMATYYSKLWGNWMMESKMRNVVLPPELEKGK